MKNRTTIQPNEDDELAEALAGEENEYLAGGEIPPEYYLDNKASLPGWPGYRTRPGQSGYDPIDNQIEAAHIQGLFIHHVLTGSLITNEPIYLFLLLIVGAVLVFPFVLSRLLAFLQQPEDFMASGVLVIPFLVGVSCLVSFGRSIIKIKRGGFDEAEINSEQEIASEQKLLISKIVFFSLVIVYILFRAIPVLAPLFSEQEKSTIGRSINDEFENTLGTGIEFNSGLRLRIEEWEADAVSYIHNYSGEMIVFENDLLRVRRFCFQGDLTTWFPIEVDEEPYFEEELMLTLEHQFTSPRSAGVLIALMQHSSEVEIMHQFECDVMRVFIEGKGLESGLPYGAYDDISVDQFSRNE